MSTQILKGETFTDVSPGKSVTSTRLNNHVDSATLLAGCITEQTSIDAIAAADEFLVHDASTSLLKRVTADAAIPVAAITGKTDLNTASAIAADDTFLVSDTSSGTLVKVQAKNTIPVEAITGKTELTVTALTDKLLISDADASGELKFVQLTNLLPASPKLAAGMIYQVVSASDGTAQTLTTAIPNDDSIPEIGEGAQILTCAITPRYDNSILHIHAVAYAALDTNGIATLALFKDSDNDALAAGTNTDTSSSGMLPFVLNHAVVSGGTSAITFKLRIGEASGGDVYMNGGAAARKLGGILKTFMRIEEVAV